MHIFDYKENPKELLTPEIVSQISKLREFKGRQDLFVQSKADILTHLLDVAKVQSTTSSNRIEGIYTSDERLKELINEKAEPRNRSEEEISGYREVLATIHESYEYINIRTNTLLQLHRDLYSFSSYNSGGRFKTTDNVIAETENNGLQKIRFQPTPAYLTENAVEQLCKAYTDAIGENKYDEILLTSMFILDFLCIHPFSDGNGRISRLLTLLLLYRAGFIVGKYISIEMLIEKTKIQYYETLKECSIGWHENTNTAIPFVQYMLGILIKAYSEFEARVEHLTFNKKSKSERVKDIITNHLGKITKREILIQAPDISETMVEKVLSDLLSEGYIEKVGKARATGYLIRK